MGTQPASKVLLYFFSAWHGEGRETLQNLSINSFEHARRFLSNCIFPRRRFNKLFPVPIKTGYKTCIKPENTHNNPSFWIVGSTKNIHKFCRVSLASPCRAEKKYEWTLLAGYYGNRADLPKLACVPGLARLHINTSLNRIHPNDGKHYTNQGPRDFQLSCTLILV
jgi:hypothetical protein